MTRIALVTGGGGNIGAAVARSLAANGLVVAVTDLRPAAAAATAAGLPGLGHVSVGLDATDEGAVTGRFDELEARIGPIAVLVCVAGGTLTTPTHRPSIADTSLDDWSTTEALNGRSTFLCVRAMLRLRRRRPVEHGRIITMSSTAAMVPGGPTGAAYGATKAAVISFSRHAALEAAPLGITVNTVIPGVVETDAFRATVSADEARSLARSVPLGRLAVPGDIGEAVAWLASVPSSYMTGCLVEVNGGRHFA